MPSKGAVRTPVQPIRLSPKKQRSICLITIGRDQRNSPTGLHVSPGRAGEVYFSRQTPPKTPLPLEVLWAVNRLQPGEAVTIEAKQHSPKAFPQKLTIAYPQQAVLSGPVIPSLYANSRTRTYRWEYSVSLQGSNIPVPTLDPVIIIEEDP